MTNKPKAIQSRLLELDALRGFAVFGILVANMSQYFLPELLSDAPASVYGSPTADGLTWLLIHALVDNKFLTLFSLLFGISFALLYDKLSERGNPRLIMARRIAMLFLFGLLHAYFFYYADILTGYAIAALALWLLISLSPRRQFIIGAVILLLTIGPWRFLVSGPEPDAATLPSLVESARVELAQALSDPDSVNADDFSHPQIATAWETIEIYRNGPLAASIAQRLAQFADLMIVVVAYVLWRTIGLFLIGAALFRSGFLKRRRAADWKKYTIWLLPLGLGLNLIVSSSLLFGYYHGDNLARVLAVLDEFGAMLLACGYASLMFWLCLSGKAAKLTHSVASVGRTALSNYIGQSAIMSLIATHYGLSMYADYSRFQMCLLAVGVFLLQVGISHWWIGRYGFGPLEWLWRCVTYFRWLPLRRVSR